MTKTATIRADQLPSIPQHMNPMRWNMDDYIITYNRRTKVCTVENFEGFTDGGEEITEVLPEADARKVVQELQPGWIGLDGFVSLWDYDGRWMTFGTKPI